MGDTKRGRERAGKDKRHQRLRREMERARDALEEPVDREPAESGSSNA